MRASLTRLAVVSLFLVSLLTAGAGAALAAPGNGSGATVDSGPISASNCWDNGDGTYTCYTASGNYHSVYTPSGAVNGTASLQYECYTTYDDATNSVLYQSCATNENLSYHSNPNGQEVFRATATLTDSTGACYQAQYHVVGGQVQYDRQIPC